MKMSQEQRRMFADGLASGFRETADVMLVDKERQRRDSLLGQDLCPDSSLPPLSHPTMEYEVDFLGSNSSDGRHEAEMEGDIESSARDLAYHDLVRQEIQGAGLDYNIIISMPDDIQSIVHRTALRRQCSRPDTATSKDLSGYRQIGIHGECLETEKAEIFLSTSDAMRSAYRSSRRARSSAMGSGATDESNYSSSSEATPKSPRAPFLDVSPKHAGSLKRRMHTQDSVTSVDFATATYSQKGDHGLHDTKSAGGSKGDCTWLSNTSACAQSQVKNAEPFKPAKPAGPLAKPRSKASIFWKWVCM